MASENCSFVYDCSTTGACCKRIDIALDGQVIRELVFHRGCEGNHRGIAALVLGQKATDVIRLLEGIQCGSKGTSCPDQLALALKAAVNRK